MRGLADYISEVRIQLQYHRRLNQKLWRGEQLRPVVRDKLLKFADAWRQTARIPEEAVRDVVITGGNVNYNYTPKSDIDVHLEIDKAMLPIKGELLDDWLYDKKLLWTMTHDVKVNGYPLEPYAHDESEGYHPGQGVYSLIKNAWVQRPELGDFNWKDDPNLLEKIEYYARAISDLSRKRMGLDAVESLKRRLREMRSAGIADGGEFSFENLVFKALRNAGYLDRMNAYERKLRDAELSL